MCDDADYSGGQVKKKKLEMAQPVLHIIAENPQKKHVAQYVRPPAVQEHGGKKGYYHRPHGGPVQEKLGHTGRNEPQGVINLVQLAGGKHYFSYKNIQVNGYEDPVHERSGPGPDAVS